MGDLRVGKLQIFASAVFVASTIFSFERVARATVFNVDSLADATDGTPGNNTCDDILSGKCTLRAAIVESNFHPGPDTIMVPAGKYTLKLNLTGEDVGDSGDLDIINDELTIIGAGADSTIIDAKRVDRVFHITVDAFLSAFTITGGNVSELGGGIRFNGPSATLTLNDCIIDGNHADLGGGGIDNIDGTLILDGTVVRNNTTADAGGGIINGTDATTMIQNSEISDNTATRLGGGIRNEGEGVVALTDSLLRFNSPSNCSGPITSASGTFSAPSSCTFARGGEFQVNSYTINGQYNPAVAADSDGFVVAWESWSQDGNQLGVFAQRFDSTGAPAGTEFQVNSYTEQSQSYPVVASDVNGNFVIAWQSWGDQDGSDYGIFAQRFDSTGAPAGTEFQVNSYTENGQLYPVAASDADGNFVVAWESGNQDGNQGGVFAQRFDSTGAPAGTEFQVNSHTEQSQSHPVAASDADGSFVIAWQSYGQDGDSVGIFAQRFDSTGAPAGAEFQVNSYTKNGQVYPVAASGADGNFVIAWQSWGDQDGDSVGVFAQRFDSTGAPAGTEFQVNSYTENGQYYPVAASDADGNFVIAWQSYDQDGSNYGIFAQHLDSAGDTLGGEFQTNTYTIAYQERPSVASDRDNNFVMVWMSPQDGDDTGIFGRRLGVLPVRDSCPSVPDLGCTVGFDKGLLLVKENVPGKEKLIAKLVSGPALAQTDMGNPLFDPFGTVFTLCIYDDQGNLAGQAAVDSAARDCQGKPCWKSVGSAPPAGKGYKYKDKTSAAHGIQKIIYKAGDAGKTKVIIKGKGPNLPSGIPAALQSSANATMQLRSSDGMCLSATMGDIKKQEADFFKAKK